MAQQSLFVLLSLLSCSAVQGNELDFSDSLHAGLKDSSLNMPKFAGLLQQHLSHTSQSASPWKAQAEVFLGLLQSMGGQVPEAQAKQTRHFVDEIIKLLSGSSDAIYADAQTTKDVTQSQLNTEYGNLSDTETKANKVYEDTKKLDGDLYSCYGHLDEITANHSVHCGEKDLPDACVRKNNTKMHTFAVAPKDTYTCDYASGADPTKCTSDKSELKTDLVSAEYTLAQKYKAWKAANKTCTEELEAERLLCYNTNNSYWNKKSTCNTLYLSAAAHLCAFRSKISTWKGFKESLTSTQYRAKTVLAPKKREWADLNVIICMMKKFRDRKQMTFAADDYDTCTKESAAKAWVGVIDTLDAKLAELLKATLFNKQCLDFSFSGGFARKLNVTEGSSKVTFFTQPNEVFSFNTDGSDGCTSTSAAFTKFCEGGSYTTAVQ